MKVVGLETTRTSITRLKHSLLSGEPGYSQAWNDKNLDYEIETNLSSDWTLSPRVVLETTRTSITRLKQRSKHRWASTDGWASTWNDKNLDYEIETIVRPELNGGSAYTWNDKNLDYEIETAMPSGSPATSSKSWNDKNLDYEIETQY